MTAIDLKKFDDEEAMRIDNLILTAKSLNSEICGLTENEPSERLLEIIRNKTYLIETLLHICHEKNYLLHEACNAIHMLSGGYTTIKLD